MYFISLLPYKGIELLVGGTFAIKLDFENDSLINHKTIFEKNACLLGSCC